MKLSRYPHSRIRPSRLSGLNHRERGIFLFTTNWNSFAPPNEGVTFHAGGREGERIPQAERNIASVNLVTLLLDWPHARVGLRLDKATNREYPSGGSPDAIVGVTM